MQVGQHSEPCSSINARTQGYGMKKSMKPIPPKLVRAVAHALVVRKVEQAWNKRMAVHGVRYAP